jgi:DNA-binding IclR family transcriptional regulator
VSKPEDIPQDVWDKAKTIVFEPYFMEWEGIAAVAYAILAEREACALAVETLSSGFSDKTVREASNQTLRVAAAAIRKRGEG